MRNLSTLIVVVLLVRCGNRKVSYLGQKTPGTSPELFAPSIVNTDSIELNAVFNNLMTEFFFTRIINGSYVIYHAELIDDQWTAPNAIPMFPETAVNTTAVDMSLTPDGNTMYFLGVLHENETLDAPSDIYRSQKVNGKWQMAEKVEYPISTDEYSEAYPVIVADGRLYLVSDRPGGFGTQDI